MTQLSRNIFSAVPPKEMSQPLERFGLVEGEEGKIAVTVMANPRPSFSWIVGDQKLFEGDSDQTGRMHVLPGKQSPNMVCVKPNTVISKSRNDRRGSYSLMKNKAVELSSLLIFCYVHFSLWHCENIKSTTEKKRPFVS